MVPSIQAVHGVEGSWSSSAVPASHMVQTSADPAGTNVPGMHRVQRPNTSTVPAGHFWHSRSVVAVGACDSKDPAPHTVRLRQTVSVVAVHAAASNWSAMQRVQPASMHLFPSAWKSEAHSHAVFSVVSTALSTQTHSVCEQPLLPSGTTEVERLEQRGAQYDGFCAAVSREAVSVAASTSIVQGTLMVVQRLSLVFNCICTSIRAGLCFCDGHTISKVQSTGSPERQTKQEPLLFAVFCAFCLQGQTKEATACLTLVL